jgi:hydrogenase 3 maturation protease
VIYLAEYLRARIAPAEKIIIMGAGSVLRADDAAGMLLIEQLEPLVGDMEQVLLIGGSTAPENFTGVIKSFAADHLFFVDAAYLEEEIGAIGVIDPEVIGGLSFSTHMLPFPIMMKYLEKEGGCEGSFIGIQPRSTQMGEAMCAEVKAAVDELTAAFVEVIKERFIIHNL